MIRRTWSGPKSAVRGEGPGNAQRAVRTVCLPSAAAVGGPTNRTIPEPVIRRERLPLAPRPKPAGPLPAPPLVYQAVSDIKVYPKPPLPKMGPAGFSLDDPTFGCRIFFA